MAPAPTDVAETETPIKEPKKVVSLADRKEAILYSLNSADQTDSRNIVLIAGKGHETYQEINNKKLLFNDKVVINQYLDEMNEK